MSHKGDDNQSRNRASFRRNGQLLGEIPTKSLCGYGNSKMAEIWCELALLATGSCWLQNTCLMGNPCPRWKLPLNLNIPIIAIGNRINSHPVSSSAKLQHQSLHGHMNNSRNYEFLVMEITGITERRSPIIHIRSLEVQLNSVRACFWVCSNAQHIFYWSPTCCREIMFGFIEGMRIFSQTPIMAELFNTRVFKLLQRMFRNLVPLQSRVSNIKGNKIAQKIDWYDVLCKRTRIIWS